MSGWKANWTATGRDQRNQARIVGWSLAWVLLFLAVHLAIGNDWIIDPPLIIAAVVGVTLAGGAWLMTYHRYLRDADELVRKVQLDALAWTSGIAMVAAFALMLLGDAGMVDEAALPNVVVLMAATYIVSVLAGQRRYS